MTDSTAIEKAREALQFYADNNYDDGGEIARAALAALSSPEGEQTSGETRWKCPHGHEFGYAAGASPKWCPGCGTSSLSRAAAVPSAGGAAELAASSCKSDGTGCECGWPERECEVASKEGSVAPSSAAPRPFVGEGHKRPPEDYPEDARFKVPQQSIWIDGAKVTARNQDGWLTIAIETTDSVMGWALSYNGRDFPTTDDALRAALASSIARRAEGGTAEELERTQRQLRDAWLADLYVNDGPAIWIADAEKKGQSLTEQLRRLEQLVTGAYG